MPCIFTDTDWARWRNELKAAAKCSLPALRRSLRSCASQIGSGMAKGRMLAAQWSRVGIQIIERDMPTSGGCMEYEGHRLVFVREGDNYSRKRFTIAHEVCHLLLADVLSYTAAAKAFDVEGLCNSFASYLLIPRRELKRCVQEVGIPNEAKDIFQLCRRFEVNVRPMVIALGENLGWSKRIVIAAAYRGHPVRSDEFAFRIEGAAGHRHFFLPYQQRLTSVGFEKLVSWAESSTRPSDLAGSETEVRLELRRKQPTPRGGVGTGPAMWKAYVWGTSQPYLIAVVDTRQLRLEWIAHDTR